MTSAAEMRRGAEIANMESAARSGGTRALQLAADNQRLRTLLERAQPLLVLLDARQAPVSPSLQNRADASSLIMDINKELSGPRW